MNTRDLAREIGDHLAARAADLERQGLAPAAALRQARLEFGGVEKFTEQARAAAGWPRFESWWRDLRLGARSLRRSPGFTCAAVLMLALGIGVNTAIFSMVDWLLLRPLAVANPGQLTYLIAANSGGGYGNGFSYPNYLDIRQQSAEVFSDAAGVVPMVRDGLTAGGAAQPVWTYYVTGNFFRLLGVPPALGRWILPGEGQSPGADPVMVLSYAFWQSRFGGRNDVIGREVELDGRPVRVVGVAPRGFTGVFPVFDVQAYLPLSLTADAAATFADRGAASSLMIVGRLRSGTSLRQAQPVLAAIGQRLAHAYAKDDPWTALAAVRLTVTPPTGGPDDVVSPVAAVFLGLAGLVLLLACVNLANLLLVRAGARRREMAVRAALGAGRARLARHLLLEGAWLAAAGGLGGVLIALAACRALDSIQFASIPLRIGFGLSWHVLAYAAGITLATALAVGIAPALRGSRVPLQAVLQQSQRAGGARQRLRAAIVALELAGSLTLLVVGGLFWRSLLAAQHVDLGFTPEHVLNLTLDPHAAGLGAADGQRLDAAVLARVRALPGVQSASLAESVPLGSFHDGSDLKIPGQTTAPGRRPPSAGVNAVSPGYFSTMGIALLRGRAVTGADTPASPRVAVVNQTMAHRFWPGQEAIGQVFALDGEAQRPVRVIGIAADSRTGALSEPIGPYLYLPLAQYPSGAVAGGVNPVAQAVLQLRVFGAPVDLAPAVADAIRALAPTLPVLDVQPMSALLDSINGLALFRLGALLAGAMAALGLLLAAVGVFGVVAFAATQRTHEIGVRIALGATRTQVLRLLLRQTLWMLGSGLALGLALAALAALAVNGLLVGVHAGDPVTYLAAAALLALITLAASIAPAWRALRADPVAVLRCE